MIRTQKLVRWLTSRDGIIRAVMASVWLAGHYVLAGTLQHHNAGSNLGLAIFVLLTGAAMEKAERLLSWSFFAWFVAGLVLSVLMGGIFYSV